MKHKHLSLFTTNKTEGQYLVEKKNQTNKTNTHTQHELRHLTSLQEQF